MAVPPTNDRPRITELQPNFGFYINQNGLAPESWLYRQFLQEQANINMYALIFWWQSGVD